MLTARAEYRLALRADNAVTRLGQDALEAGCVSGRRRSQIEAHLAKRGSPDWMQTEEAAADATYAPYVERQRREWEALRRDSAVGLGAVKFSDVPGLSSEMAERLSVARPETLDQASRIAGITPAALAVLHLHASRRTAA
jgi:tRNA uridine 5-carboxymethylaminomethyl modification enzyme